MKNLFLTLAAALLLTSCGGVSITTSNNEQLGEIPSVYLSYVTQKNQMADKVRSQEISPESALKQTKELDEAMTKTAQKAIDQMRGKEVFFSFANGYNDDRFEIEKIVINDLTLETGALDLKVWVIANQYMDADINANLKYIIINDKNEAVAQGEINPFIKQKMITSRHFPFDTSVREGQYCHDEGTSLMLYCGSYDMTGFKQIVFIP